MANKEYHYKDELNDDFAGTHIDTEKTPDNFVYVSKNPFFIVGAFLLYYLIAKPILWLICKIKYHQVWVNKKVLKKCKKQGYFIYANHTLLLGDASFPTIMNIKKNYIIVSQDTLSIKGLKTIVRMLGAIPLSNSKISHDNLLKCVETRIKQGGMVTIYPEAHIWPYYTEIRPFNERSFRYPVDMNTPVYSLVNTYHKSKLPWRKRPVVKTILNGPFYPDMNIERSEAMLKLRNEVYDSMVKASKSYTQYSYNIYKKDN